MVLLFSACKTSDTESFISKINNASDLISDDCSKGNKCTVELLRNKDYTIIKDSMDKIYPEIVDGDNIVVKYTYEIGNPDNYADGNQSETIHFVIHKNTNNELKDEGLKDIKLLFGKNCFCRDIQGFYEVDKGSFKLKSSKNKTEIDLELTIPKLGERQFVKKIHFTLE